MISERSKTGRDETSITTAITRAVNIQATKTPGSTMEAGSASFRATQPPTSHHSHAVTVDDMAPMQKEIAINTVRDRCSCMCSARSRTLVCVACTSDGLAVTAIARSNCPVLSKSAAKLAHSEHSPRCELSQAASGCDYLFRSAPHNQIQRALVFTSRHCGPPCNNGRSAATPR